MQTTLPEVPGFFSRFGIRGLGQLTTDLGKVLSHLGARERFTFDLRSAGLVRPDLSFPAHAGRHPADGLAPIFNLFDREGGGKGFRYTVTRARLRDFRGGRLSYDEHDGTDFVCPVGTPLVAAAPGVVVAVRDRWLRGGMTACVDHGGGLVTQYTHLSRMVAEVGQQVARGEVVALSGRTGMDMTLSFPWVPPHVHFMVWLGGRPMDPFCVEGEPDGPGTWLERNTPRPADGPVPADRVPSLPELGVDGRVVQEYVAQCRADDVRAELEQAFDDAARAAIIEDSLHHDRDAWPEGLDPQKLRAGVKPSAVRITLPLPSPQYRGARFADSFATRPSA